MTQPARVLLLIDHLGTGGAQEFLYQLYRLVDPARVRFEVAAMRSGGIYAEQLAALGATVRVLAPSRGLGHVPGSVLRLGRLLRAQRYDCVHTLLQGSYVFGTPLARLTRTPTIHSLMSVRLQVQPWYFPLMGRWQRWVAAYLTYVPQELFDVGIVPAKVKAVEVTVDLAEMTALRHDPRATIPGIALDGAFPVVLSVGRLHPDKGHEHALRAWPQVLARWPSARLLIVGDGEDEARLKALAAQLDLGQSVVFTGYCTALKALFTRADLLLRTSINEGVNLTTIQALAASLPVIGFHNPAPKEVIIHGENGWLTPLGDHGALAAAIDRLSGDEALRARLGQQGRASVRSYYDMRRVVEFYQQVYDAIRRRAALQTLPDMHESMARFRAALAAGEPAPTE